MNRVSGAALRYAMNIACLIEYRGTESRISEYVC
jgi:hypothetical protein